MLLRSAALLAGVLVLGVTALVGLFSLWESVHTAIAEYGELRQIEAIRLRVARAEAHLNLRSPDLPAATQALSEAISALQVFGSMQTDNDEGSEAHEDSESAAIAQSVQSLQRVLQALEAPSQSTAGDITELAAVQVRLRRLAQEADALVAKTQRRSSRDVSRAVAVLAGVFLMIAAATVAISLSQYRGIVRPLDALRRSARLIASGRFSERAEIMADAEFTELAGDFNKMTAELEQLYRTLEQKVEQKSRELLQSERLASVGFLAAGVAHEINNPLGIISGYAELSLRRLQENGADPAAVEDARQTLSIIREEAFRCREITEKLLSLARSGGGRNSLVPLGPLVHEVAQMLRVHSSYRERTIEVMICRPEELLVRGNDAELKQVLLNLLVNALESTAPGSGRVLVEIGREADRIRLAVSDNGCGMDQTVLQRVFEPFFSARHKGGRGVGLGLSITRAIIEGCGGTIEATSDGPGKGSRMNVVLPAAELPAQRAVTAALEKEAVA